MSSRRPSKAEEVPIAAPAPVPEQQHQVQRHHSSKHSSPNIIGSHYKVGKKIGEGSFGIIYEGVSLINHAPCAIKFEPRKSDAPQLRDEFRTYKIMQGSVGIPNVYYFGQEGLHNILCIDLLGPSLEDMFDLCGRKFSVKTVCMAAKQMLTRIQAIHEKNLIYRDIKPDNFLIGRLPRSHEPNSDVLANHSTQHPHPASQVFIVDFGMAKQYRDPKTKVHIPYREKKSLSGTARYMSVNTHLGREQSRRDDLEALGHVFMYFLRGSLPWQGLKAATNKQKYEKIGEKKQGTSVKELCDQFPEEFGQYLSYSRNLKFEDQPDYDFLRGLFNKVLHKRDQVDDGVFDWMLVMDKQRRDKERRKEQERQAQQMEAPSDGSSALPNSASVQYPANWDPTAALHPPNQSFPNHTNFGSAIGTSVNAMAGSHIAPSPLGESASLPREEHKRLSAIHGTVLVTEEVAVTSISAANQLVTPTSAAATPQISSTPAVEQQRQPQQPPAKQVKKKKRRGFFSCCT